MTADLLSFEQSFRRWIHDRGMGWERTVVRCGEDDRIESLAYRFSPAEPSRGVVLTLHGAGNDALFAWVGLFKRLLDGGYEVFTFDLPGHGRGSRGAFSPEEATDVVERALTACLSGPSQPPVHAIGVSLGASVLLQSLPRLQTRLASAVLMVAPLRIVLSLRSILTEVGSRTLRLVWKEREHYGLTGLIPSFGPFKRDIYPLRLGRGLPPGPFGYVDGLNRMLEEMDLEGAAREVDLPLLLVYGSRDRIVPIEQGRRLARLMPSASLCEVPGGTHLSTPLEGVVTTRLLSWIEEHG